MTVERPIFITSLRLSKVCSCLVYFCTNHIGWSLKCMHFLCSAGCFGGQMRIGLQIHDSLPLKHKNLFLGQKSLPKFKTEENMLETWFNPMFTLPFNHLLPAQTTGTGGEHIEICTSMAEPSLSSLYVKSVWREFHWDQKSEGRYSYYREQVTTTPKKRPLCLLSNLKFLPWISREHSTFMRRYQNGLRL